MALRTQRIDYSQRTVSCEAEGCDAVVTLGNSFSHIIGVALCTATTGPAPAPDGQRVPPFGCDAQQHFGCCPEHAAAAAQQCITEHLLPKMRQAVERHQAAFAQAQAQTQAEAEGNA